MVDLRQLCANARQIIRVLACPEARRAFVRLLDEKYGAFVLSDEALERELQQFIASEEKP